VIFSKNYTVKWHDTDANRMVTPSHILAYMQETANRHLASCGMTLDELRDRHGLAFLLSRITLRFYLPLCADDHITVQTWVCESRGLSFLRCFRVLRGDDIAAEAYSTWALLNLNEQKLMPVSAFPYDIEPDPALTGDLCARVRIPPIAQMTSVGNRKIVYSDIDYNGHMNNTHYPNMLCDFTPGIRNCRVTGMTLSFLHEAAFDHTLDVLRLDGEAGEFFFRTQNKDGIVCLEARVLTEALDTTV
jgi:YbgC/YbaW family acyl-CoA thioester hydrolase